MAKRLRLPAFGMALPWGLAALSLLLAFGQRHGRTYVDTRIELTTEPGAFLRDVTSVWSSALDLGHVQSGQFVGYLFPMGPYFAGADALGIPMWITERIWLAAVLWLGGWGTVRLLDVLYSPRRGVVHLLAATLFLANPYVVVQANRATASLLSYAALPWILLAAHRGLREPRGWRWPAVIALAVAASSGGTNAATVFWVLTAPLALLVYEVFVLHGRRGDAVAFAWRAAALTALASAWWIVPVMLQGSQAPDFLAFTEQPQSIWSTTSMSESLRLMGYWLSYFQTGFGGVQPASTAVHPYFTSEVVVAGTFAVPLLAFGGLLVTRRWTYAPFFGLLAIGALLVMAAGYPSGKPAAGTLEAIYYHVKSTQFLRTTYKAGPLLALAMACLAGVAARELWALVPRRPGRSGRWLRAAPGVALTAMVVLFAYPLFRGHVIESAFAYGSVPGEWRTALDDAARTAPQDRRVMVIPGQLFGAYRWGQTFTSVAPALTRHPVLQRSIAHYADPRAVQLQQAVDDLVQQDRLVPGQLAPLLDQMGVAQVLVASDGLAQQTGETPPATIAAILSGQSGFDRPARTYGPFERYTPLRGHGGPRVVLPALRRYANPDGAGPGPVRVHAARGSTILDGDGDGIAELAAGGRLSPDRALFYAGDLDRARIRDEVRSGAELVFSDTNRRRRLTPSAIRQDVGPTLPASERLPRDAPTFDLFPDRGTEAQTVADFGDAASLRAPTSFHRTLTPGRPPYLAFDGRLETAWFPPEPLPSCACLEVTLRHPRLVPYVRVHPSTFGTSGTPDLWISVNGGHERKVSLSPLGWNRIGLGGSALRTLRLRVTHDALLGTLGINEVQLPGVSVSESLRLPTWLASATRGMDLRRNAVSVELQRATSDFPFRPPSQSDQIDPERGLSRLVTLPARRRFTGVTGWASPSTEAPDPGFDRLAGVAPGWRLDSSSRFEGVPGRRASSALDGDPATAWVGDFKPRGSAWISLGAPRAFVVDRFQLARGPAEYGFPAQLDVEAEGETFRKLRPAPDGTVVLPRAVRTRALRLEVTQVDAPGRTGRRRALDAVAIGELRIPGVRPPAPRRHGTFHTACGELVVRSRLGAVSAEVSGRLEDLDRGSALSLSACGRERSLELPAGTSTVAVGEGPAMRPYLLSLRSPGTAATTSPGVVRSPGHGDHGAREDVRLALRQPAWLVLGEAYAPGWRAACRPAGGKEQDLGAPEPVDGFANGWRVDASCSKARFWFAPQRAATVSYLISALAGLAVLGLLAAPVLRRRTRPDADATREETSPAIGAAETVLRLSWKWSLAAALALGLLGSWFFALRAGPVLAVAVVLLGRVGVSSRRLLWLALPLLALVPAIYVFKPISRSAGFFGYADTHLAGHWLAVAAVCALAGACLLDARGVRRLYSSQSTASHSDTAT